MSQAYTKELRADSANLIIPVITFLAALTSLLLIVGSPVFSQIWHYLVIASLSPIGGRLAWHFIKNGRQYAGGLLFISLNVLLLSLVMYREWSPTSAIPYLFGIFVVSSSMIIHPLAGFYTWVVSSVLIFISASLSNEMDSTAFASFLPPLVINLTLAVTAFLSAIEWQTAVESVSELHLRAQSRRDELFKIQEELSMTNARLHYLNDQLDSARQEAVGERDLRTRFMNNVSHELRTPLNAIVNFAHILALGGRGEVNEFQVDYLKRIQQAGWHLLSVLNDLLDMAQIQAGEFKLHLETTDLHQICEEAMTNTRGLILEKEVELVREYPEIWPLVQVDKMRIKQSLINLLGNAAKYTEEGYIAIRVHSQDGFLHLAVEDTGIGIAPEHHDLIFKEFHQVDETAARKRIGTGLGLPITRHLIERHGGKLIVDSTVGKGSKFIVMLPIVNE